MDHQYNIYNSFLQWFLLVKGSRGSSGYVVAVSKQNYNYFNKGLLLLTITVVRSYRMVYFQFGPINREVFFIPEYQVLSKSNQQASSYEQNSTAYNNHGFSVT